MSGSWWYRGKPACCSSIRRPSNSNLVQLGPGDHINIPARQKHRVEWTHPDMTTVWLCVFY